MRIHDQNVLGTAETAHAQESQKLERGGAARTAAADPGGDRVELSSTLGRLSRVISAHSAQRADRVQALAVEYQAGRYHADARTTSSAMIREALASGG